MSPDAPQLMLMVFESSDDICRGMAGGERMQELQVVKRTVEMEANITSIRGIGRGKLRFRGFASSWVPSPK